MATAVAPRIVGLEDNETTLDLPDSLRNTADAKRSFPALNYAFAAGHAIALESDGAGALSIRVTNPGGLVHSQQLTKGPASVFLQQNDFNLGFSLCDLSNKYKQAIYGVEDDELEGWMPTEHSPYFAFETKYTKASKRLMTAKTSLTLATAGCALDGKAFEASSFVDALEAVEASARLRVARLPAREVRGDGVIPVRFPPGPTCPWPALRLTTRRAPSSARALGTTLHPDQSRSRLFASR